MADMFGGQLGEGCDLEKEVKWGRRAETETNGEAEPVGHTAALDLRFCSQVR